MLGRQHLVRCDVSSAIGMGPENAAKDRAKGRPLDSVFSGSSTIFDVTGSPDDSRNMKVGLRTIGWRVVRTVKF